jgi:tetratricopeptide (TPR) repeat protein
MEALFGRAPHPDDLGYEAATDAGAAAMNHGATALALAYFERARSLRPTGYALAQCGKCLRDLGRLEDAAEMYSQALEHETGSASHARVGYIAVLCDLRRYEEALPLAQAAAAEDPTNPAALNVAARCVDELAGTLANGGTVDPAHLQRVRTMAAGFRARAAELEPVRSSERLRQRRERAFPLHSIAPPTMPEMVPVEQAHGRPLSPAPPMIDDSPSAEPPVGGLLTRLLRALGLKRSAH